MHSCFLGVLCLYLLFAFSVSIVLEAKEDVPKFFLSFALFCATLMLLRPFFRKGLKKMQYDLHHVDLGKISEKAGEGSEDQEEKEDLAAQYYGTCILAVGILLQIYLEMFIY